MTAGTRRVAAIDCGTNSIRLLIADLDDGGRLTDVTRLMRVVRLGQGVDATGRLAKKAQTSSGKRNKAQPKSRDELREVEAVDKETGRTSIEYRRRS